MIVWLIGWLLILAAGLIALVAASTDSRGRAVNWPKAFLIVGTLLAVGAMLLK